MGREVDPATLEHYAGQVPLRRLARPEEVADLVAFLAGPAAGYLTGQDIVLDAGWSVPRTILADDAGQEPRPQASLA